MSKSEITGLKYSLITLYINNQTHSFTSRLIRGAKVVIF